MIFMADSFDKNLSTYETNHLTIDFFFHLA